MNGNGHDFPSTGNPLVDAAIKRLSNDYKELKDAMIVQAHLEAVQTQSILRHEQWLEKHDIAMREFDEKLNVLTMWLMKRKGLPEAGGEV